ncbi:MAG TPA: EF-P lysine aminoacylase GenX [Sedimenticola sp.]|nr:EF-P lysine aminoacylase GenX [Sedimenticola sp.]
MLEVRAGLLDGVRRFFRARGVLEVETPILSAATGTDPALEPFVTRYLGPGAPGGQPLYLQTSPEFPMKRLLAAGSGDIFQVAHAFRQGERGPRHNPEFTLLEWYRTGFDHHRLMEEVAELVNELLGAALPVEKVAYRALFRDRFGWDPLEAEVEEMAATAAGLGLEAEGLETRDQWLDLLMGLALEPGLGRDRLTFVHDYPASQASLARLCPADSRLACRFELYLEGMELANGFHELTDADEQLSRFEADNRVRLARSQEPLPVDHRLIEALRRGLPDCAGVALGLDRLLMLKQQAGAIDEVLSFPLGQA